MYRLLLHVFSPAQLTLLIFCFVSKTLCVEISIGRNRTTTCPISFRRCRPRNRGWSKFVVWVTISNHQNRSRIARIQSTIAYYVCHSTFDRFLDSCMGKGITFTDVAVGQTIRSIHIVKPIRNGFSVARIMKKTTTENHNPCNQSWPTIAMMLQLSWSVLRIFPNHNMASTALLGRTSRTKGRKELGTNRTKEDHAIVSEDIKERLPRNGLRSLEVLLRCRVNPNSLFRGSCGIRFR